MKKFLIVAVIAVVGLAALGITSLAYAQDQIKPLMNQAAMQAWMNSGMHAGRSFQGGPMGGMHSGGIHMGGQAGVLHDYMHPAMAEALGLTPTELDEQIAAGETFWSLAQAQGLTDVEIRALMLEARTSALDAAVAGGVITQAQADQMLARMGQMHGTGAGQGPCHGGETGPRGPRGPRGGQTTP